MTFGMYPYILIYTTAPTFSLTVFNAATDSYEPPTGFAWSGVGFVLFLACQLYVYSLFWGKTRPDVH